MTPSDGPKSTGEVMADIMGNVGNLVRNEVDLVRAEVAGSLNNAAGALGVIAFALVLAVAGINLIATILVGLMIMAGVPPTVATAIVGAGLLLMAVVLYLSAKATLSNIDLMPNRAARSVRRNTAAIKEAYNDK